MIIVTGPVYAPVLLTGNQKQMHQSAESHVRVDPTPTANEWIHIRRTIGSFPRLIQVPTHFFKVVFGRIRASDCNAYNVFVGAFMVPNSDTVETHMPLQDALIRIDELESLVGFSLWHDDIISNGMKNQSGSSSNSVAKSVQLYLSSSSSSGIDSSCKDVDNIVPTHRSVARVLSSSDHATTTTTTTGSNTGSSVPVQASKAAPPLIRNNSNNSQKRTDQKKIRHYCQFFDCSAPLFASKHK